MVALPKRLTDLNSPQTQCPAQAAEFAYVIRIMRGDHEDFAQGRVPIFSVWNLRREIARWILHDRDERVAVGEETVDGCAPGAVVGLGAGWEPVVVGEGQVLVIRILDVIEDVRLGDAHVFEQLPEGIGRVWRLGVVLRRREIIDDGFEALVRLARGQGIDKLLTKVLVVQGKFSPGKLLEC